MLKGLSRTTPLFLKLRLLKFEGIVKLKCCTIMFSAYRQMLPKNLQTSLVFLIIGVVTS